MLFQFGKNYFLSRVICGRDSDHLVHAKQPCGALMQREFRNIENVSDGKIQGESKKNKKRAP